MEYLKDNTADLIFSDINMPNIDINIPELNKYIVKIEIEIKKDEKLKYISGLGILCNIPSKNMKCLMTYNNFITFMCNKT